MHVVVDWQVLQVSCVVTLVEHQLELIVHRVRNLVLLAIRHRRRREDWVDRYFYSVFHHSRD